MSFFSKKLVIGYWLLVIPIAIFLRLALIPHPGFEADVSFWKSWGLATYDKGIVEGMKVSNNNYPTPFAYTLGMMVKVYSLFKDPHNFNEYWSNTNVLFLFVSKLPAILADFGIAAVIVWISTKFQAPNTKQIPSNKYQMFGKLRLRIPNLFGIWHLPRRQAGKHQLFEKFGFIISNLFENWSLVIGHSPLGLLLASVYLLNPISLIDGAWWGQVDSLGVFIFLLAIVAALTKRPTLAGVIYMVALMTKLQNMIYGPLFFLFIWQTMGYQGIVRSIAGSALAFFGLNIEFLLAREMGRVISSLTQNFDYFPWMSLNAFNLWWIVAGTKGMQVSDKLLAIGIINAKTLGLLLFSSFYLFAMLRQFFPLIVKWLNGQIVTRKNTTASQQFNNSSNITIENDDNGKRALQIFLESLIIVNAAFFLFQTQSHDRYAFPLSVLLLLWFPFFVFERSNEGTKYRIQHFATLYVLFSIVYFYNLHTALVLNYPNNGLPILSNLTQPFFTITTSVVLLGLFAVFLAYLARCTKSIVSVVAVAMLMTLLFLINLPLILKKPVSLTNLTPYVSEQGYGLVQKNMPVNASLGFNSWSPLSVQYVFYRKGIGTHAPSRQAYHINGLFTRLTTDYGIDTEGGSQASAIFQIFGDDKLLFQSEKIGRYEYPKHTEVDITGIKILTLVTTDAGDGNTDDHTDWLRPTLWP